MLTICGGNDLIKFTAKVRQTLYERKRSVMMFRFKTIVLLAFSVLFLGYVPLKAQSVFEFTSTLTRPLGGSGFGVFTLEDDLFTYDLDVTVGFSSAEIRGPGAAPDAPVVLTLDLTECAHPPAPLPGSGCFFDGSVILAPDDVDDLIAGQWWIWARSPISPDTPMSGQIVPEPNVGNLLAVSLILLLASTNFWSFRNSAKNLL